MKRHANRPPAGTDAPALTSARRPVYNAPAMNRPRRPNERKPNRPGSIPPLTVKRLSLYLRYLEESAEAGQTTVSSRQAGRALGLSDAQVRKDLAHFGQFGRRGVGYYVEDLARELRKIFGTDRVWDVALIGVGRLGRALLGYAGFLKKGFRVSAAFDSNPRKVGREFESVRVQPMADLAKEVASGRFRLAILSVPAEAAQEVTNQLCLAGIRGILNFAPVRLSVPGDVTVVPVDLAVQLEQLSYFASSPGVRKQRRQGRRDDQS